MKDHLSWETVLWLRRCEVEQEFTKAPPKIPQFSTTLHGVTTHNMVSFVIIIVVNPGLKTYSLVSNRTSSKSGKQLKQIAQSNLKSIFGLLRGCGDWGGGGGGGGV